MTRTGAPSDAVEFEPVIESDWSERAAPPAVNGVTPGLDIKA